MDGALVIVLALSQLVIVVWLCYVLFSFSKSLLEVKISEEDGEEEETEE